MKLKNSFYLFFLLLFCSISSAAQAKNESSKLPPPIIDVHLHAFKIMPGIKMDFLDEHAPQTQEEYESRVLASLKKYNIYAFASGEDSVIQNWKNKEPQRIFPSRFIQSPKLTDMDQLKQEIKNKQWDAIGEVVTQYAGLPANDRSLDPLYSLAEEMDIPVGIHLGLGPAGAAYNPMFSKFRVSLIHPFYLEDVLIKHPHLRLYAMHAGYPMINEMLAMLYAFPQLYVDISVINWVLPKEEFYRYLKILVDAGYEKRIMYGSDEMYWPQGIALSVRNIQEAPFLTEAQKRDIFFNNAVRFFKLNPADFGSN